MWPAALAAEPVRSALAGRTELRQETVRLWRHPRGAAGRHPPRGRAGPGRPGDHHLHARGRARDRDPLRAGRAGRLRPAAGGAPARHGDAVFSTGPTLDDLVAGAFADRGLTVATAESCTGGLLAGPADRARRAPRPGCSAGSPPTRTRPRSSCVGVPAAMLAEHGAVSPEVAAALAEGARARFGADVGVGITGIAGPGGGTADKPVGTVHLCVAGPDGQRGPVPPCCPAHGRRCGTAPSRWRCTCCANSSWAGRPPEPRAARVRG